MLVSTLLTQANAESTSMISEIIRKITKPQAGEETFMYAAILICLAVLYLVYT